MVLKLFNFLNPDHLGTSTALTDYFGNAYQFFLNLPFGETMAQQLGSNYYNSPYKFNGKELDEETGFYYYGARYYDPRISIFQSVDPLVEQTMDAYGYCYQNPINLIDPTGMSAEWHPENGNLVADKGDSTKSLAEYQGISYEEAAKQLADNCYKINDKGILSLKEGDIVNTGSYIFNEISVGGGKKGNFKSSDDNIKGYNINKAVSKMSQIAHKTYSQVPGSDLGSCARFVRYGVEAGFGMKKDQLTTLNPRSPVPAREWGWFLKGLGFEELSTNNYIKGDIVVMQGYKGGTSDKNGVPYGHIAMYDGKTWMSYWYQSSIYAGNGYKKNNCPYKILDILI